MSTTAPIEVTPAGHDLDHWAEARRRAARIDLTTLLVRLGVGRLGVEHGGDDVHLVVVSAHPDDETLGLGRLIHQWARTVGPVTVAVATAGEACFDHVGPRPEGLAERRLAEWRTALDILGVSHAYALGLADGSLAQVEPDLTDALRDVLRTVLADAGPRGAHRTVLACPWRGDPHPDHQAVGRVVGDLARELCRPPLEFGVWMTYWSEPAELETDGRDLVVLTTDGDDDSAHRRACSAFATQVEPFAPGLGAVVPPTMLAHHHEQLLVLGADLRTEVS